MDGDIKTCQSFVSFNKDSMSLMLFKGIIHSDNHEDPHERIFIEISLENEWLTVHQLVEYFSMFRF